MKNNSEDLEELVSDLVDYMYDRDTYEFKDCYNSKEEAIEEQIRLFTSRKAVLNTLYQLHEDISESDVYLQDKDYSEEEMSDRAKDLYKRILNYKKNMKDDLER